MSSGRWSNDPWYPTFPKDFLTDSAYLMMSWEERGFYRHLLDLNFLEMGLPEDPAEICKLIGMNPRTFRKYWARLEGCFPLIRAQFSRNSAAIALELRSK